MLTEIGQRYVITDTPQCPGPSSERLRLAFLAYLTDQLSRWRKREIESTLTVGALAIERGFSAVGHSGLSVSNLDSS